MGGSALYSIIGKRWKKDLGGITKWRGWTIPDRDLNAWICPVFHPSYVERADGQEVETVWIKDLEQIIKFIDVPLPEYIEPEIEIIEDLSPLNKIQSGLVTIDYETTGLKPHAEGHRIVCCGIADTPDHCYVFMMPDTRKQRQPLIDLLVNKKTYRI